MAYRNVEHCTTGASPAMLLQRRPLRARLDLLRGDRMLEDRVQSVQGKQVEYSRGKERTVGIGNEVLFRNYDKENKWGSGRVENKLGSRHYVISRENGPPVKRHIDQIRKKIVNTFSHPSLRGTVGEVQTEETLPNSTDSSKYNNVPIISTESMNTEPPVPTKRIRKPVIRYPE